MTESKSKNEDLISLTVYDALEGTKKTYDEGTIALNCAAAAKDRRGNGPLAFMVDFFRGDMEEFLEQYNNRRPISLQRAATMALERDHGLWVDAYPNLFWDWNGSAVNGGHCATSALKSKQKLFRTCVVIGVSPRIKTRIDIHKTRTTAQQMYYLKNTLANVTDGSLRTTFAATCKQIWIYLHQADRGFDGIFSPSVSADKICQTPTGQAFLQKCEPYFTLLHAAISESGPESFCKSRFFIPAMMLCLTDDKIMHGWALNLIIGDGEVRERGSILLKCRNTLLQYCAENSSAANRDSRAVNDDVERILALLHAKALGHVPLEIIPFKTWQPNGQVKRRELSPTKAEKDAANRTKVIVYFAQKIIAKL